MQRGETVSRERGFTLIEILIVVAILAIMVAIAIPNLLNAIERSRQSRTVADIRLISEGVELYQNDNSYYPVINEGTASELTAHLELYIRSFNPADGWGEPVVYDSDGSHYTIISHGGNKAPDPPYFFGTTSTFDADIVFAGGSFLQWPDGPQS
jgi:general secretion pathway protein G